MDHLEYGRVYGEFGSSTTTACYNCDSKGSGLISDGWDTIEVDGNIHAVCPCEQTSFVVRWTVGRRQKEQHNTARTES